MTIPEIPNEITAEARKLALAIYSQSVSSDDDSDTMDLVIAVPIIERALLARDQRAAEIARTFQEWGDCSGYLETASIQIADRILTYDKEPSATLDDDGDYYRPDASGYSRADEEWFFDMDGKP